MTIFNAINAVYSALNNQGLPVHKLVKPAESGECVVINALPLTGSVFKRCYINVNIYAKDLLVPDGASVPNTSRLNALAAHYAPILERIINNNAYLYLESEGIEADSGIKFHYLNFRLLCNLIEN